MSYKKVEDVNKAICADLTVPIEFDVGRVTDYNIHADASKKPICWMVPQPYTTSWIENTNRFFDQHRVELYFYKQSKLSNDNVELFAIIKQMDEIAKEFAIKVRDKAEQYEIDVANFTFTPVYLNHAKNLVSGILMQYNLNMPDDFDYCP